MNIELLIVLILLGSTILLFVLNRPRMDAVALIMMTLLPFTGVITVNDALAGFSDPNIVLIALLFVIGEGLVYTGVVHKLGNLLIKHAGNSETKLITLLMTMAVGISSFMSSTGVIAIFIPIVLRIARSTGVSPRRLLIPLSTAGLLSGMMTLVATPPNLIVQSELIRQGFKGFHFFSFIPFGIPVLILAITYMIFASRWLDLKDKAKSLYPKKPSLKSWIEEYKLNDSQYRLRIEPGSKLVGQALQQTNMRTNFGINISAIERKKDSKLEIIRPTFQTKLSLGDVIFINVLEPLITLKDFCHQYNLTSLTLSKNYFVDHTQEIGMAELMIPANSKLIGKSLITTHFRSDYNLTVIGIKQTRTTQKERLTEIILNAGDTYLLLEPGKILKN